MEKFQTAKLEIIETRRRRTGIDRSNWTSSCRKDEQAKEAGSVRFGRKGCRIGDSRRKRNFEGPAEIYEELGEDGLLDQGR